MRGRKPTTSRFNKFYRTLSDRKWKKRKIAWLQLAVWILMIANPLIWKFAKWFFINSPYLESLFAFRAGTEFLQDMFLGGREKKVKGVKKRKKK